MKQCDVTIDRKDLRWLDGNGNENTARGKHDYVFRSSVTDEAQRLIEAHDFDGSYMRSLSTGHVETQWINLAMLSFAERYNGIVGVTLEALARDKVAQTIIHLPAGRMLYEVVEAPWVFKVSTEEGIEVPNFNDDYASIDTWEGRLFSGMRLVPDAKDKAPNKQAERIKGNIYIELQPEFVAKLGSVNMEYGPFHMDAYRAMTQRAKEEGSQPPQQSLVDRIRSALGV